MGKRTIINRVGKKAEIVLGKEMEKLRTLKGITRGQLGRAINVTDRQIEKFEAGDFVSLPVLEEITEALGEPIPKKLLRKISFLRKLEKETDEEQVELSELYREAFTASPDDDDE